MTRRIVTDEEFQERFLNRLRPLLVTYGIESMTCASPEHEASLLLTPTGPEISYVYWTFLHPDAQRLLATDPLNLGVEIFGSPAEGNRQELVQAFVQPFFEMCRELNLAGVKIMQGGLLGMVANAARTQVHMTASGVVYTWNGPVSDVIN